jgi:O-antigen ligase
MTVGLLVVGGLLAVLVTLPPTRQLALSVGTVAIIRAPFWLLLTAVAGGQLLFNDKLSQGQRFAVGAVVLLVVVYAFAIARESASNWVGVGSVVAILAWLRFRRARWIALTIVLLLLITGLVFPTVWGFAGGEDEWTTSGQSRLVLIERVLSVSMRNPITGLGPVAYRNYAGTTPLAYQRAFWLQPQINSHNNFVDIFAQFGLVGLTMFGWMAYELVRLGLRLLARDESGFEAGYVRAMLAAGAGALAIMFLADWILPFVYNIGFPGFQASVLIWLFLGGLVALEARARVGDPVFGEQEAPKS